MLFSDLKLEDNKAFLHFQWWHWQNFSEQMLSQMSIHFSFLVLVSSDNVFLYTYDVYIFFWWQK